MNGNVKTKIVLHIYDEDIEVTVNENDVKRYQAAASLITQKMDAYARTYASLKSEHTISLMAMLDLALNSTHD